MLLLKAAGDELQVRTPGEVHAERHGGAGNIAGRRHVPVQIIQRFR
jgi:hypothetical protein